MSQPAGTKPAQPRYSPETLRRIKYARVARDTILAIGGVAFAVIGFAVPTPGYTHDEPVGVQGIILAVVFGIAAFARAGSQPKWNRTWTRGGRYTASVLGLLFGLFLLAYVATESGYVGPHGIATTSNCQYLGLHSAHGSHDNYACHVEIRWSDGTVTQTSLGDTGVLRNGMVMKYGQSPVAFLTAGPQPVSSWPTTLFDLFICVAIILQALFSLVVLIFGGRRRRAKATYLSEYTS